VLDISIGPKADRFLQGTDQQSFDRLSRKIRELANKPRPRGVSYKKYFIQNDQLPVQ